MLIVLKYLSISCIEFASKKITFFGKKAVKENVDVMAGRERQLIGHPLNHFSGR